MSILVKAHAGLSNYKNNSKMILTDIKGNANWFPKSQVKQMIRAKEINPIDFQLDRAGRLISKKVDYRHMCRSFNVIDELNQNEQQMILFYGLAKTSQLAEDEDKMLEIFDIYDKFYVRDFFNQTDGFILKEYWCVDKKLRERVIRTLYMISTL